ncbi:BT4734/BF3469 family protein [Pontibacter burrus]|uniref:VirE protein n=1 Tax=Pontibacter burrus TaxID=2704466 RepID=A0A6B3LWE5_9BACT|nr:BT4734/BF3469 family protein [Pontibacter burrus]NEM98208.1 VirE protein [Pontibacter burrus]
MDSILNTFVSCFKDYTTAANPVTVNLHTWLTSDNHAATVGLIRSGRKELKALLPAITPSGIFSYRSEKDLILHSGFIQFDIDFKDNQHITNYSDLKHQICNIPNVAYCGLSVSGKGYWGLIPIAYPDKHKQHFAYLQKAFAVIGVILDPAPKNVASLRGYSCDSEAYFNHLAKPLYQYETATPVYRQQASQTTGATDERVKVEACLSEIAKQGIDITSSYLNDWLPIGSNFASTFGESGRVYFHQISQYHPKYSQSETDRQYDRCLKKCNGIASIGAFLSRCAAHGINYKELLTESNN